MREVEAAKQRGADLAEANRLGADLNLGADARVIRVRIPHSSASRDMSVIMLASVSVVTLCLAAGLAAAPNPLAAVILGVITVACSLATWLLVRHGRSLATVRRVFRYPAGIVQVFPDEPEPRVLRWAEVHTVTLVFNDSDERFNGLSSCTLDGTTGTMEIGGWYPKSLVRDVAFEAERTLAPRIVPPLVATYASGQPMIIGSWRIDQAGVTENHSGRASVLTPWSDVGEITVASEEHRGRVEPASLIAITVSPDRRRGRGRPRPRLSLSGVPNGTFLPHLFEHIAERNGIPLRKAVVAPGKGGS
jgi:hypothetical protein